LLFNLYDEICGRRRRGDEENGCYEYSNSLEDGGKEMRENERFLSAMERKVKSIYHLHQTSKLYWNEVEDP
jgi:hypothetical protein